MAYNLISKVNDDVVKQTEYEQLVENAIDFLGFDRKEVVSTGDQYEKFISSTNDRKIVEYDERARDTQSAASSRAGEREWLQDIQKREPGSDIHSQQNPRLGISSSKTSPQAAVGHVIILPGREGVAYVTAGLKDVIYVKNKNGDEFVVRRDELVGPRVVGNKTAWMIKN